MKYCIGLFLLVGIWSCQGDVKTSSKGSDTLFVDYYVRYLQNEGQLKAEATFKKGKEEKKAKHIEIDGSLMVQNMPLRPVKVGNTMIRYQNELKRKYEPSYLFSLEYDDGKKNNHTLAMPAIEKFTINGSKASKKQGMELTWEGPNLSENERLLVLITDKSSKAHSITINGPSKKQSAKIDGSEFGPLATGQGFVYLVKKQENSEKTGETFIHSAVEYYSEQVTVNIVD